jgi:hypothetical protein
MVFVQFGLEMRDRRSGGLLGSSTSLLDNAQDVAFLHDKEVFAVDADLGPGPLAEQDEVAGLDVEGTSLPLSSREPGPTATTSPSCGFSFAMSGMMIPPLDLRSPSARRMTTRSWRGRNFMRVLSEADA